MNLNCIGSGLFSLTTATAMAEAGNEITLTTRLKSDELLRRLTQSIEDINISSKFVEQVKKGKIKLINHWFDLVYVEDAPNVIFLNSYDTSTEELNEFTTYIAQTQYYEFIFVLQTTFLLGKTLILKQKLQKIYKQRGIKKKINVVVMPLFIGEGSAYKDFTNPDLILIGSSDKYSVRLLTSLFQPFNRRENTIKVVAETAAEYTKYAINAILATRITLINELANNAEKFKVDIEQVRQSIGADKRIGSAYLYPGCGFGGPHFAEEVNQLLNAFNEVGSDTNLLANVIRNNEQQKEVVFRKIWQTFKGNLQNKIFAIWGLSFKANTATINNAPAIKNIDLLLAQGAIVQAYDPMANDNLIDYYKSSPYKNQLKVVDDKYAALSNAIALVIFTEWREFQSPNFKEIKKQLCYIFDGRNIYDPYSLAEMGFKYYTVGRMILSKK